MFCKYFLPVCGLSFHSPSCVFCTVEVFNLMESNLAIFHSWIMFLELKWRSHRLSPMSSSRNFIALHFTSRSRIYLELTSVKGVIRLNSKIQFFACLVIPAPLVEMAILSPLDCLCFFVKGHLAIFVGFFPEFSVLFHCPIGLLFLQ